jgi:hypothetical protein
LRIHHTKHISRYHNNTTHNKNSNTTHYNKNTHAYTHTTTHNRLLHKTHRSHKIHNSQQTPTDIEWEKQRTASNLFALLEWQRLHSQHIKWTNKRLHGRWRTSRLNSMLIYRLWERSFYSYSSCEIVLTLGYRLWFDGCLGVWVFVCFVVILTIQVRSDL